jgi:RND family efflux transporter MFP subunit
MIVGVAGILASGFAMYKRGASRTNDVPLSSSPKPVTVVVAREATFRPTRRYVATIDPWLVAKVGPQLVSAYVDTVLFRPGAPVKKGDVLATLDCRNASAESQAVAMAARALETKQAAAAKEAARLQGMLDGGFVSENEADKKMAEATAQQADILAAKAKLLGSSLEVNDCVLKAPFDGEVDARMADPGSFARPGSFILSVVDRSTVRIAADVPETDFALVAPGALVKMRIVATGTTITAPITRRNPSADLATRTVHFEVDVSDPERHIPVGTTVELWVDVGEPQPAAEIPLIGASVRGDKATVFVVGEDALAKKRTVAVLGETAGSLFVELGLSGAKIVTEGRGLLEDGDKVTSKVGTFSPVPAATAPEAPGSVAIPAIPSGTPVIAKDGKP